jgi:hypothetical protein
MHEGLVCIPPHFVDMAVMRGCRLQTPGPTEGPVHDSYLVTVGMLQNSTQHLRHSGLAPP